MADICPVCDRSISFITKATIEGINVHVECTPDFLLNPEKYGGKPIEKSEAQIKAKKEHREQQQEHQKQQREQEEKALYKSVRIKGGVDVKGFSMPFGEMVIFALKWMLAMIPALILFWIIMAIFTAIFGISLLSIF